MSYMQHQHLVEILSVWHAASKLVLPQSAPYVSLLRVCAQLTLQTGHQPLVRVVQHQTHQLHPPLDLCGRMK